MKTKRKAGTQFTTVVPVFYGMLAAKNMSADLFDLRAAPNPT